jgi:hypothetical protein
MSAHLYHVPAGNITVGLTLPCGMMPAKPYLPPGCVQDGKIVHNTLPTLWNLLPITDGKLELA